MSIHLPPGVVHMSGPTMPNVTQAILDAIEELPCCYGAVRGPDHCTCWEAVFDVEQEPARTDPEPQTRSSMCDDCAYRCDSPERNDKDYVEENLLDLPYSDNPFWCHKGMRLPAKYVHPAGHELPGDPMNYQPLQVGGVPYKADGTPADRCGGWATRRKKVAS